MFRCRLTWLVRASFKHVCVCFPSSSCVFKQPVLLVSLVSMHLVSPEADGLFGSGDLKRFLARVVCVPPLHPPSFFPSTNSFSVDRCMDWGLTAGLWGFASHGSGILSRGWLATVEAPGYPRHPL